MNPQESWDDPPLPAGRTVPDAHLRNLWAAVLLDALYLARGLRERFRDTPLEVYQARRWLRSEARYIGSCRWICESVLGIDLGAPQWRYFR
jgi:hypothetical protein